MKINCLSLNWRPHCSSSISSCGPAAGVISLSWLFLLCRIWEGYRAFLCSGVTTSSLWETVANPLWWEIRCAAPSQVKSVIPFTAFSCPLRPPKDQTQVHPILISRSSDWSPGNPYCNPIKEGAPLLWRGWGSQCTNSSPEGKVPYKYFLCIFYTL